MSWGCRGAENMEHTQSWSKINVHAPNFITTLHYIDSDSGVDTFESSGNPVENAPGVNWTILNLKKIRLRNCKKFHPQRLHVRAYPTHFFGKICFCATVHLNALGCRGQLHHYLWCPLLLVKKKHASNCRSTMKSKKNSFNQVAPTCLSENIQIGDQSLVKSQSPKRHGHAGFVRKNTGKNLGKMGNVMRKWASYSELCGIRWFQTTTECNTKKCCSCQPVSRSIAPKRIPLQPISTPKRIK